MVENSSQILASEEKATKATTTTNTTVSLSHVLVKPLRLACKLASSALTGVITTWQVPLGPSYSKRPGVGFRAAR